MPVWAQAGLAAALAAASYAIVSSGSFAATQRMDPSLATLQRNQWIAAGLAVVAGLAVAAKKSPIYGAGIAAGGLVTIVGAKLSFMLGGLLEQRKGSMSAVYGQMGNYARMNAVYGQMGAYAPQMGAYAPQMGAVYGQMGAMEQRRARNYVPAPPWQGNPFG